jgi:hypothetical protein
MCKALIGYICERGLMKNSFSLRYTTTALMAIASVVGISASSITPAQAQSGLQFVGTPSCVVNETTNSITCRGEVAGAGTSEAATVTSTATITSGCLNEGSNDPKDLETTTQVTASEPFTTDRGTFTVSTQPITGPAQGFTCPSPNMIPVLVDVTFSDITLTITAQIGTLTETF